MKVAIAKAEAPYVLPKNGKIPPNKFKPIFHYALLNDRGYPSNLVQASTVGMKDNRFQAQIVKPLMPSSNRIIIDDSVESRLHRLAQGYIDTQINPYSDTPYDLFDMNILKSDPLADYQERHIDFEDYSNPELKNFPNFSVMLSYEERASACVWDESHHAVGAAHQVQCKLIPAALGFSEVASILKEQGKEHLMEGITMKEIFFGRNQAFVFLDNAMHSGAANHMNKTVYRLHFYVVRRNSIAPSKYTFFPSEIVWDLTRSGSKTPKLFLSELKKNKKIAHLLDDLSNDDDEEEDDEDDEDDEAASKPAKAAKAASGRASPAAPKPAPKAAKAAPKPAPKEAKAAPKKNSGDRSSSPNSREMPERKRGRPRKYAPDDF